MKRSNRPPTCIQLAFSRWLRQSGYRAKRNNLSIEFIRPKSQKLELQSSGRMNKAMQQKWIQFLNQWLDSGKSFIDELLPIKE